MDPVSRDAARLKQAQGTPGGPACMPRPQRSETAKRGFGGIAPFQGTLALLAGLGLGRSTVAMASAKTRHALNEAPSAKSCGLRQGLANHSGLPTSGTAAKTVTLPKAVLGNYALPRKGKM